MLEISRTALFGKLDPVAYKAIEGATVFCKLRGNPYVELQHWLHQILNAPDSDLHRIVRQYGLDASVLASDLMASLDRLPRGASSITDLSSWVESAAERAWVYASLLFGEAQVRTGHLVVALLKTPSLRNALLAISRQFERIRLEDLSDNFGKLLADSPEQGLRASETAADPGEASGAIAPAALGRQEALKRYAVDLTERARRGELDPVAGRDGEIRQIIDILMRRRQNNPILTGEACTSSITERSRFSNSPFMLAPACIRPMSSTCSDTSLSCGGTSPPASRSAKPSTTAVLPTPASPVRMGLFWRRRIRMSMICRISPSRPATWWWRC